MSTASDERHITDSLRSTAGSPPPPALVSIARQPLESDRGSTSSPNSVSNGVHSTTPERDESHNEEPIAKLQLELDRTIREKETLATQYNNLLAKLTAMRTTLGNKLKQDAEELDRREQIIQQLTAQNDDLSSTNETLQSELIASHKDAEHTAVELDTLRARVLDGNAAGERELRETQAALERCRMEKGEWESAAMKARMQMEQGHAEVLSLKRELEIERERREIETVELEAERERANNLQAVLEDFQAAKDHELRQSVKEYETQLLHVTQSLAEFKHRALTAELALEEARSHTSRAADLQKEVKEKTLLIGKLRHEAVIINEHLIQALRRLRTSANSSSTSVDRQLVTNVLLQFLSTPREDPKRFEMLRLLGSVLSWNDTEREKAGLARIGSAGVSPASGGGGGGFWGRSMSSSGGPTKELEKTDETESFSRLWVEFLLTEAASGENGTPKTVRANSSLPSSPSSPTQPLNSNSPPRAGRKLLSSSPMSAAAGASAPNLTLSAPPPGKSQEPQQTR